MEGELIMCECQERGFTMGFGIGLGCNGEKNELICPSCVEIGEKLFKEYFSNYYTPEHVENTDVEK
jgi:hypothetical protein